VGASGGNSVTGHIRAARTGLSGFAPSLLRLIAAERLGGVSVLAGYDPLRGEELFLL
jgi:hypothetical protein